MIRAPAPWHLWVIGVVSLLWNAMGALDYTMTELRNAAYLSAMTPPQIAWLNAIPAWAVALWAIGVWGGVAGSLLLLARRRWAVAAFALSLVGVIGITLFQLSSAMPATMPGGNDMLFKLAIVTGAVALLWYARAMQRRNVIT